MIIVDKASVVRCYRLCLCLSVCLSLTFVHCSETPERIEEAFGCVIYHKGQLLFIGRRIEFAHKKRDFYIESRNARYRFISRDNHLAVFLFKIF